ncbi:MAG: methyltransferase domain-containing protein [Candidatus Dormibacteraeota bacterium]|nr:methyltransferase domain-containing protein [Candidatus Dormibacteraeota bacterium]
MELTGTRQAPAAQATPAPALGSTLETLEGARRYAAWLYAMAEPHLGPRVLEVGSGTGTLTQWIASKDRVAAVEVEPAYARRLRDRFAGSPSVEVYEGSATDVELMGRAARGRIDSAMCFNVLEHIPEDEEVLKIVHDLLPVNGRFVCFVPAHPLLYGPFDRVLGHVRRYTRRELTAKLAGAGFRVVDIRHVNLPGSFLWFLSGRVLRRAGVPGGATSLRAYDRFLTPLTRTLEARVRPPFGQSLIAIGERR